MGVLGDALQDVHLAELALRVVAQLAMPVRHPQHLPAPSTLPALCWGRQALGTLVFTFSCKSESL